MKNLILNEKVIALSIAFGTVGMMIASWVAII
jgi:hypothetical protein